MIAVAHVRERNAVSTRRFGDGLGGTSRGVMTEAISAIDRQDRPVGMDVRASLGVHATGSDARQVWAKTPESVGFHPAEVRFRQCVGHGVGGVRNGASAFQDCLAETPEPRRGADRRGRRRRHARREQAAHVVCMHCSPSAMSARAAPIGWP